MNVLRRLKERLGLGTAPIRHGHVYIDRVTGERFEIITVGRFVEVDRFDAEHRPENNVRKGVMRDAIRMGIVSHDTEYCPHCGDQ